LFSGGSAVGNVIGANLADRYGKQRVMMLMLFLASLPLFAISQVGWSPWLYLLVPLSGALTGAVHSIVVVLAQRAMPAGMATASGLTLGFMFSSGALGTLICGPIADKSGFAVVFIITATLTILAALVSLLLREK
jgi:predicted MFS family arabinose efflux permease